MPRGLRTAGLIALAIAVPVVVASATYAIGVRSLTPATRLQVNVADQTGEHSTPSAGRSSDDHGGATPGRSEGSSGADDHGGSSTGTSGGSGSGSTSGGSSPSGEDHHGGSGSDDTTSGSDRHGGSGSSGSGSSGSDHSGHGGGGGGGDD